MKNKKILKSLAAMAVGTVMVAGSFSLAACGHKHTWGEDYGKDGASGHYRICTGCDEHSETEPHTLNNNGECTVCHWTSAPSTTVAVASVSLNKNTLSLKVGASETLTATISPANATNKNVTWAVTAGDAVTVSASGAVTAVKEGTATVTVTTQDGDKTATCTVTVTNNGGGEENPPVDKENKQLNVSDVSIGTLTNGTELVEGIKVVGAPVVDANSKKVVFNGEEVNVANRIKLSQKFIQSESNQSKAMGFEVNLEADATILVYAYSGTSDAQRDLAIYDSNKAIIGSAQNIGDGNGINTAKFDVEANKTYYIGAHSAAGVNVYYIAIFYKDFNETWTHHDAVPASCTVDGTIEYSDSNYGRFKDKDDNIIARYQIVAKNLGGHNYSLKADSITVPTATATGSATLVCATGNEELPVTLPVLSDPLYTQTDSTNAGKKNYSIVKEGVTITFEADAVTATKYKFEDRYTHLFDTAIASVGYGAVNANQLAEGLKMYGITSVADSTAYSTGISVEVTAAKRLEVKDTNTTDTAYTYIVLDTAKTSGVYKISGTLYMPTQNGSWSPFQLIGSNVQTNSDIAFAAIRSDGSKKLGISTDNTNTMSATTANAYTKETDITFEIVLDLDAKTVTLKIGNEEVVSATNAIDISNSLGTNGWQGIRLQTAGGARNIYLSNLTIAERVVDTTPEA